MYYFMDKVINNVEMSICTPGDSFNVCGYTDKKIYVKFPTLSLNTDMRTVAQFRRPYVQIFNTLWNTNKLFETYDIVPCGGVFGDCPNKLFVNEKIKIDSSNMKINESDILPTYFIGGGGKAMKYIGPCDIKQDELNKLIKDEQEAADAWNDWVVKTEEEIENKIKLQKLTSNENFSSDNVDWSSQQYVLLLRDHLILTESVSSQEDWIRAGLTLAYYIRNSVEIFRMQYPKLLRNFFIYMNDRLMDQKKNIDFNRNADVTAIEKQIRDAFDQVDALVLIGGEFNFTNETYDKWINKTLVDYYNEFNKEGESEEMEDDSNLQMRLNG
ncbi:hypothetical protein CsNV_069 [Callinectes sapidus nudivirus]|nr:hypothetical protein CsNV_069 [Callinectes sapidus nudivirus]